MNIAKESDYPILNMETMKNIREISLDPKAAKSLKLIFTSQNSQLFEPAKLQDFNAANQFLNAAFPHEIENVQDVDIYVTKHPLYHGEHIVYSTLVHGGEQIDNFWIETEENKIPFQVNADDPIIVVNGRQDADGVQLSIVHEVAHLLDEEPDNGNHGYMESPREQRARAAEVAFYRWMGVGNDVTRHMLKSRYQDADDLQF